MIRDARDTHGKQGVPVQMPQGIYEVVIWCLMTILTRQISFRGELSRLCLVLLLNSSLRRVVAFTSPNILSSKATGGLGHLYSKARAWTRFRMSSLAS